MRTSPQPGATELHRNRPFGIFENSEARFRDPQQSGGGVRIRAMWREWSRNSTSQCRSRWPPGNRNVSSRKACESSWFSDSPPRSSLSAAPSGPCSCCDRPSGANGSGDLACTASADRSTAQSARITCQDNGRGVRAAGDEVRGRSKRVPLKSRESNEASTLPGIRRRCQTSIAPRTPVVASR